MRWGVLPLLDRAIVVNLARLRIWFLWRTVRLLLGQYGFRTALGQLDLDMVALEMNQCFQICDARDV